MAGTSEFDDGLELLKSLSDAHWAALHDALSTADAGRNVRQMSSDLARTPGVSNDQWIDVLNLLLHLYAFGSSEGTTLRDVVHEVGQLSSTTDSPFAVGSRQAFEAVIEKALGNETWLEPRARVFKFVENDNRLFRSAKLFTDLRPVFVDANDAPVAMTILHSLQIRYGKLGEESLFELRLGKDQLDELSNVLTRASKKAEALRTWVRAAQLDCSY